MKARFVCLLLASFVLPVLPGGAAAGDSAGPQRNLLVELRWVDSSLSGAVLAGSREGAVVAGTAGSVSPRGQLGVGTRSHGDAAPLQQQRLLVLNGQTASIQLNELTPIQWVDMSVNTAAQVEAGAESPGPGSAAKVRATPRQGFIEQTRSFPVSPHWPGGRQAVRVALRAQGPGAAGSGSGPADPLPQLQLQSTVLLPLGEWLTVARSGAVLPHQERGIISSRDAENRIVRELQLRVELAP